MYTVYSLLGPSVVTVGVGAHIIQPHLGLGLLGVRLEKHGLAVTALGARVILKEEN